MGNGTGILGGTRHDFWETSELRFRHSARYHSEQPALRAGAVLSRAHSCFRPAPVRDRSGARRLASFPVLNWRCLGGWILFDRPPADSVTIKQGPIQNADFERHPTTSRQAVDDSSFSSEIAQDVRGGHRVAGTSELNPCLIFFLTVSKQTRGEENPQPREKMIPDRKRAERTPRS